MVLHSLNEQANGQAEYNYYEAVNNCHSEPVTHWAQIAEATMPLMQSKMASANRNYTQLDGDNCHNGQTGSPNEQPLRNNNYGGPRNFQESVQLNASEISRKLIVVNAISLCVNLAIAMAAFHFAFANNSSATSAFAADCVLDFISSAIVLWRYSGDNLSSVYRHAREQIACIYLGALFEISALAIIVKATSDMVGGEASPDDSLELDHAGYDLVYLAVVATLACSVLLVFKCALYKTIRDKSILLDVINTLISTVFATSIIMSQALISVDPTFWYLDPIISIILALFMAAFGLKVIHQNFNILRPVYKSTPSNSLLASMNHAQNNNWQKSDYFSVTFA